MFMELAAPNPWVAAPKALIGLLALGELPGDPKAAPKEPGPKEAGEKALPKDWLDIAAIGERPDMAVIGFENEKPGKPL